jgi:hypothetical protein
MEVSRPHPEEARSAVSKDESHRALMVRDGARAPPHHEGESRSRLRDAVRACIRISNSQNAENRNRHCEERSDEAIHSSFMPRYGLLRFARNDVILIPDIRSQPRDAMRPSCARKHSPPPERAQGMPGAWCARRRACEGRKQKAHALVRSHRKHPAFPAQWFTTYFVLSPVIGLFCHRRP